MVCKERQLCFLDRFSVSRQAMFVGFFFLDKQDAIPALNHKFFFFISDIKHQHDLMI